MAKGSEPDNIVDIAAAQAARAKSAAQGQGVVDLREIIAAQSEIARAGPDLRRVVDTITDKDRLRRDIEEIRHVGIGFDDGEFNSEVRCAAMPVYDFSGQVTGAIGISGPVWRLSIQGLQSRTKTLAAAAKTLSEAFGASDVLKAPK